MASSSLPLPTPTLMHAFLLSSSPPPLPLEKIGCWGKDGQDLCGAHGQCEGGDRATGGGGTCICNLGWFGVLCQESLSEATGTIWEVRNIILTTLFGLISVALLLTLVILATRPCHILRKILLLATWLACTIETIYLAIDPGGFRGIFPDVVDSLLFQSVVGLITTAYSILISLWVTLLRNLEPPRNYYEPPNSSKLSFIINYPFHFFRTHPIQTMIVINLVLIWCFLFPAAVLLKTEPPKIIAIINMAYFGYLGLYSFVVGATFIIFGLRLYFFLPKMMRFKSIRQNAKIRKVSWLGIFATTIIFVTVGTLLAAGLTNYTSSPTKFLFFQTFWACLEWVLSFLILILLSPTVHFKQGLLWMRKNVFHRKYSELGTSAGGEDSTEEDAVEERRSILGQGTDSEHGSGRFGEV